VVGPDIACTSRRRRGRAGCSESRQKHKRVVWDLTRHGQHAFGIRHFGIDAADSTSIDPRHAAIVWDKIAASRDGVERIVLRKWVSLPVVLTHQFLKRGKVLELKSITMLGRRLSRQQRDSRVPRLWAGRGGKSLRGSTYHASTHHRTPPQSWRSPDLHRFPLDTDYHNKYC
jgi:hypothetical protein